MAILENYSPATIVIGAVCFGAIFHSDIHPFYQPTETSHHTHRPVDCCLRDISSDLSPVFPPTPPVPRASFGGHLKQLVRLPLVRSIPAPFTLR